MKRTKRCSRTAIRLSAIFFLAGLGVHFSIRGTESKISHDRRTAVVSEKKDTAQVFPILLKTTRIPGDMDTNAIKKLKKPIRALAAFYAAMGGALCDGEYCGLTTALGLGKQGSQKHKKLVEKYFPGDKVAETLLKQDFYLRPGGASTFSEFEYLTIRKTGDTVKVDYNLMIYAQGEVTWIEGPDIYLFKDGTYEKISRNLWQGVDN